jgi:ribonuclease P protein component
MPYAYKKSERLRKNTEFVAAMKGKRLSVDGLSLFYIRNAAGNFRVGISVGKKLANAAKRNKLRRRIRGCVALALKEQALGYDLVFIARRQLVAADFERIRKSVETALRKSVLNAVKTEGTP